MCLWRVRIVGWVRVGVGVRLLRCVWLFVIGVKCVVLVGKNWMLLRRFWRVEFLFWRVDDGGWRS